MPPRVPDQPQAPPESIALGRFDGLKNTVRRERLGPRELARAINIDLDDDGQIHRRRGYTKKLSGAWSSLFQASNNSVYGVQNGDLVLLNPDYSSSILRMGVGGDFNVGLPSLAYAQVGKNVYFSSTTASGVIDTTTNIVADWGDGPDIWLSPVVNPTATLPDIRGKLIGKPPLATQIAYFNGRLYLAQGKLLWATELFLYNYVDKTRGFFQFEDDITMVGAVSDGLYVGTTQNVYFLQGEFPQKRTQVMGSGVIPGSLAYVPQELANPPQVGLDAEEPVAVSVAFMTENGFCVGSDGGKCLNLTETHVFFPQSKRAASMFRRADGYNQYGVVLDHGGTPAGNAAIGDYVDVQIIRNPIPMLPLDGTIPPYIPHTPPTVQTPEQFDGFGAVVYDGAPNLTISNSAPIQLTFTPTTTDELRGVLVGKVFWDGALLQVPSPNAVILVKLTLTVTPLLAGGYMDVSIGSSATPPFANEATQVYKQGAGVSQQQTFTFAIMASEAFGAGGYINLTTSVPTNLTAVRLGVYPLST